MDEWGKQPNESLKQFEFRPFTRRVLVQTGSQLPATTSSSSNVHDVHTPFLPLYNPHHRQTLVGIVFIQWPTTTTTTAATTSNQTGAPPSPPSTAHALTAPPSTHSIPRITAPSMVQGLATASPNNPSAQSPVPATTETETTPRPSTAPRAQPTVPAPPQTSSSTLPQAQAQVQATTAARILILAERRLSRAVGMRMRCSLVRDGRAMRKRVGTSLRTLIILGRDIVLRLSSMRMGTLFVSS